MEHFNFKDFDLNLIKGVAHQSQRKRFNKSEFLKNFHKKQLEFLHIKSDYIVMITGRRPGKSYALAGKIVLTDQLVAPGKAGFYLYATTTMGHAHELMFDNLMKYDKEYSLGWDWSQYKKWGVILTPNKTIIRLMGLYDDRSWKKPQGLGLKGACVDEAQLIENKILINYDNEICSLGRLDFSNIEYGGQMIVAANPPKIHAGHLYDMHLKAEKKQDLEMCTFKMNIRDNPYYTKEQIDKFFKSEGERLGRDSPAFLRNAYGVFAKETDTLVYNITDKNIFTPDEISEDKTNHNFVTGIDMGYHDKDAIGVLECDLDKKVIYVREEFEKNKMSFTNLANKIKHIEKPYYIDIRVADFGGLGLKAQPEFHQEHGLYMIRADKSAKMTWVEKLRDLINLGRIKFKKDSIFVKQAPLIEYNETFEKLNDKTFHSDIHDAILYAVRYVLQRYPKHFQGLGAMIKIQK